MASSKGVVIAALFANGAIAILKFGGWLLTGSPSMLSETYHSISDTGNQVFLLIGLRYGGRSPTRLHPFGYGKAQFFYSFLVSVLLFGIAGWESAKHGYEALVHGHTSNLAGLVTIGSISFPAVWVNYGVLSAAMIFEAYALSKAHANMQTQIDKRNWSGFVEAFRKTSDVTVLTAFTEDTIAMVGAGLALIGVFLTRSTGNPIYDAAAALLIGVLLMSFAVALAWENKRLLLGESLPADEERKLREAVTDLEGVIHIDTLRTVFFGPNRILVTADISVDPELDAHGIQNLIDAVETRLYDADDRVKTVYVEPEL